ncbi:MAG: hypothetical protein HYZ53_14630 [Planctomycetes bacterium]|nr:hypothetical protein [Planctomycetota bacterium]
MIVLGVHYETHDTGAAVVADGRILSVVSEERLSRRKSDGSAPRLSAPRALQIAGVEPRDVDVVAISGSTLPEKRAEYSWVHRELRMRQGLWGLSPFLRPHRFYKNIAKLNGSEPREKYLSKFDEFSAFLHASGAAPELEFVPHTLCHLAAAYYTVPDDRPWLVVDLEGQGGRNAGAVAIGEGGKLKPWIFIPWPHSVGRFYAFPVKLLGYKTTRHAGKITGLAGRGDPERLYSVIRSWIQVVREPLSVRVSPILDRLRAQFEFTGRIPDLIARVSPEDLSAAFQRRFEEVCVELISEAVRRTGIRRVALTGGCFANVRANQLIAQQCGVEEVFVHPGMGDVGLPLGAAYFAGAARSPLLPARLPSVFFGPSETDAEIERALVAGKTRYKRVAAAETVAARLVAQGFTVGHFDGRMEYGPRALGNRTILASAKDPTINDTLNVRLKRNEFMPFAPAILAERVDEYLEVIPGTEYSAEFMTITYHAKEPMRRNCAAAVHVDGTARAQVVHRERNPRFHRILSEYYRMTGVPSCINTSYNMHEEPIVCSSEDAVRSFQTGSLDYLVAGPFVAWQESCPEPKDEAGEGQPLE